MNIPVSSSAVQTAGTAAVSISAPSAPETAATTCCPTCGSLLADQFSYDSDRRVFIANGVAVRFTHVQGLIVGALWRKRNSGAIESLQHFADIAWINEIDGGPETYNVISVHLDHIRKRLRLAGYTITKNIGQPKVGYRIVPLESLA